MKLLIPDISMTFLEEPSLIFAGNREHVSQKQGISVFGPHSMDDEYLHPGIVRIGLIGSGQSIESARKWMLKCAEGVSGEGKYSDFPGFLEDRGFFCKVQFNERWDEVITQSELKLIEKNRVSRDRFDAAVELIIDKIRLISEKDNSPSYVVIALPDEIYKENKTVDFTDKELGRVHLDFRRAIKARSMPYHISTQILLQRTTEAEAASRQVDHISNCAWNFYSSLYYKTGGIPWTPKGLSSGSCYVGISFHRVVGSKNSRYYTSIAQAFDEHGNGLVLRGQDFSWDESSFGKSPHLNSDLAYDLIRSVLKRYKDEQKQTPARVVIHKTSKFWCDERDGIESALEGIHQYDLLSVAPENRIRLLRDGQYPVLRGTQFSIGKEHYLYTVGYIPALQTFPHGHVPAPLKVYDHVGDSSIDQLLREVLVLSKMNWNTANFGGLMPITLRFSKLVGEILRELPEGSEPLPQFKYYM